MDLGLDRISILLKRLGNPQSNMRFIHVAGTNGKGSTCAYLSSILTHAGYRCGSFTSPFLYRFEERIRIDGKDIDHVELKRITERVRDQVDLLVSEGYEHPTEFELMFAVAICYFHGSECDVSVIEVGLGGRLDSTNVITPLVSVITPISLDHIEVLGNTYSQIAKEKAGIIKFDIPVVSAYQREDVSKVLIDRAMEMDTGVIFVDKTSVKIDPLKRPYLYRDFSYKGIGYRTQLLGRYQPDNAALAIECIKAIVEVLPVSDSDIKDGISEATWPGRFEIMHNDPMVIMDGAHNVAGASSLVDTLEELFQDGSNGYEKDNTFVMGVLKDKEYPEMLEIVSKIANRFIFYTPKSDRALGSRMLAETSLRIDEGVPFDICDTPREAMQLALERTSPKGLIVAFGTLYALNEIKCCIDDLGC